MTELPAWKKEYARLRDFIADHPEIVLTKNEISIPQPVRDEFYRLFDDIRRAVAVKHLDTLSVNARILSERYTQIEKEAAELLRVEKIEMPIDLDVFLHTPEEALIRAVYNCLFGLIQGKIGEEEFERLAQESIATHVAELFRLGYERWVGLELIKLLDPEEAFFVGLDDDLKPCLCELESFSFGRQCHHPTMRMPELVVRSRRFNSLVAIKLALAAEIDEYLVQFQNRPLRPPKKRTGDTSFALDSRAFLLSFLENDKKIPVYADIFEGDRTPPDWLVEFTSKDAPGGDKEVFGRIRWHMEILNPKFGCTLIAASGGFQPDSEIIPENVHLISPGFDIAKLEEALGVLST